MAGSATMNRPSSTRCPFPFAFIQSSAIMHLTRMDCKTAPPYLTSSFWLSGAVSWMEQASEVPLKFFCLDAALFILYSMDNIDAAHANPLQPKVGVLALTLELYETLAPELRLDRENWVRREMLPALGDSAEVLFERAVFRS